MKKRFISLLLTLVMLVSLIPTAVITASAATGVSEAGVRVIKQTVGFHKYAYQVSETQWKIGYGTPSIKGAVIEEKNADKLLRDRLSELNATVPGDLLQRQRDALVWLLYSEGLNSWGSIGSLAQAVVSSNKTGSELVYGLTAFNGNSFDPKTSPAILNRRLCIANLYLTGNYGATVGTLGYTLFDANGGKFAGDVALRFQTYDTKDVSKINVVVEAAPVKGGVPLTFMGWYDGSALITGLGTSTLNKTLKAMWQESDKISVNYTLPAVTVFETTNTPVDGIVPIMDAPNGSVKINNLNRDEIIRVVAEKIVGGWKWLELSTGGWVKFYSNVNDVPGIVTNETVTVLDDYVNIRADKSFTAEKVGIARKGETVTILKIVSDSNGNKWGYCSKGWIYLAGTDYLGNFASADASSSVNTGAGLAGVISGAEKVNIRSGAGVQNGLVTTMNQGTAVTVYEQTDVNGAPWGRIGDGRWVAMMYVTLNQSSQGNNAANTNANRGSSAVVSSNVNLAVRTGPGTGYTKVTSLVPGTSVVILRTQNVGGVAWGQIDQGWINLNYVTMIGSSVNSGPAYGVTGTVVNCSSGVNIRSAAGPANALVGVARLNSKVTVTEIVKVNGHEWGHIGNGWVCMDYVQLDSSFNPPASDVEADVVVNDLMTVFDGYPAKTNDAATVLEEASAHAKELLTLSKETAIKIRGFKVTTSNLYGKVTIGDITGWINMNSVDLETVNVKVTATSANSYEEPSTRSKFFAALTNGTQLVVKLSKYNYDWTIADGIFWGMVTVKDSKNNDHNVWINMADVTMFRENASRNGITTLSGVGYMTGYVKAATDVYLDSNGNVSLLSGLPEKSSYTLAAGQQVNILARNVITASGASAGKTFGKVSVGSVVGWIDMGNVVLDPVQMKATAANNRYTVAATDSDIIGRNTTQIIEAGTEFTITDRRLIRSSNEVNNGLIDVGVIYIGEYTTDTALIVLDEGKMAPVSAATLPDNANPFVSASVIVSGKTNGAVTILEEASVNSRELLTVSDNTPITILNWNMVNGVVWGKVQINKIVGWVNMSGISFAGLSGTVKNGTLSLYTNRDKASSVQILRLNDMDIPVNQVVFDGRTVWGNVTIGDKNGWADLLEMNLGTPTADYKPTNVIATGKVNSMKIDVTVTGGSVISLPKGTNVSLTEVTVAGGTATWTAVFGDKSGKLDMDYIDMNSAVATVTGSSIPVYGDFQGTAEIGRLYRGETTTVSKFKAKGTVLCGEITFNNESAWIVLAKESELLVGLVSGTTNNNAGSNGFNPTNPTENTTPTAEPTAAYIVCSTFVNIRSGAGVEYPQVTRLPNGQNIKIYEKTISAQGVEWARIDEGWVCMDYVKMGTVTGGNTGSGTNNGVPSSPIIVTTVPAGAIAVGYATRDLDVYGGAGFGYGKSGTIAKNLSMVIYENTLSGGVSWGRTDAGWVILSYVVVTGIGQNGGTMGTIGRCGFTANVRSTANGLELTKVMINSRVAILETSGSWARTALGWISTDYIVLDSEAAPLPQAPTTNAPVENSPTVENFIEVG